MMLTSIRHKFVLAMLLTTVVALLVSTVAMLVYNINTYRDNLIRDLKTQAALLGQANTPALQFDDSDAAVKYLAVLEASPDIMSAAIYNSRGALFASYIRGQGVAAELPRMPDSDSTKIQGQYMLVFMRIVSGNEILGTVFIKSRHLLKEKFLVSLAIAGSVLLLALAVALAISLWLQSSVTQPILSVSALARKVVESRDYSLRARKTTEDETGYLVDAFNALLQEVQQRREVLESTNRQLQQQIEERITAEQALRKSEYEVMQLNAELEQRVAERTLELENSNRELEAFSYSVSHDLRAPLRAIDGFSQALLEDYEDKLDDTGEDYLLRVRSGAQRMGGLIDDMLKLSRVNRVKFGKQQVDLTKMAEDAIEEMRAVEPDRCVNVRITSGLSAYCDPQLTRIALQNLLSNAWKYTSTREQAEIEFGMRENRGEVAFFVQDNGVGFDMGYTAKLFSAFQRLHNASDFAGTGVGLATTRRVISRHGGDIWAEAEVDKGAVFYFTLSPTSAPDANNVKEESDEQTADITG